MVSFPVFARKRNPSRQHNALDPVLRPFIRQHEAVSVRREYRFWALTRSAIEKVVGLFKCNHGPGRSLLANTPRFCPVTESNFTNLAGDITGKKGIRRLD